MWGIENIGRKNKEQRDQDITAKERKLREDKAVITNRSILEYEEKFKVKFAEMKGQTILDIGSGKGDFFEKASKHGVKVVSINPEFKKGKDSVNIKDLTHPEGDVGARAQEMPFADNSFDSEFALYSVPYWLPDNHKQLKGIFEREYERCIDEIIRTLKPNGKAYIYPIDEENKNITRKILESRSDKINSTFDTFDGDRLLVLIKK